MSCLGRHRRVGNIAQFLVTAVLTVPNSAVDSVRALVVCNEIVDARNSERSLQLWRVIVFIGTPIRWRTYAVSAVTRADRDTSSGDVSVTVPPRSPISSAPHVTSTCIALLFVAVTLRVIVLVSAVLRRPISGRFPRLLRSPPTCSVVILTNLIAVELMKATTV